MSDFSNQDLESWLASKKLTKLLQVLNDNEIDEVSDFLSLESKQDIQDFAEELNLKVMQKRKFIKAVLEIIQAGNSPGVEVPVQVTAQVPVRNKMSNNYNYNNNNDNYDNNTNNTTIGSNCPPPEPQSEGEEVPVQVPTQTSVNYNYNNNSNRMNDNGYHQPQLVPEPVNEITAAYKSLLKQWKLDQYIEIFNDEGYDDIELWPDLTLQELKQDFRMKSGHAKKFLKMRDTLGPCTKSPSASTNYVSVSPQTQKRTQMQTVQVPVPVPNKNNDNNISEEETGPHVLLLKQWELDQYIGIFSDEGYENVNLWPDLTQEELQKDLQMKAGHAKQFLKMRKTLGQVQNPNSAIISPQTQKHGNSMDHGLVAVAVAVAVTAEAEDMEIKEIEDALPVIETPEELSLRKRSERRAANAHLRGNENYAPHLPSKNDHRPSKTIMVIGATGAGKTTLLNSLMNYLYEVEFDDLYRFKLIKEPPSSEAGSRTNLVTPYYLSPPALGYDLTVIDTPGFGDTRGISHDKKITKRIKACFENKISSIDAICFVVQAPLCRLTAVQNYVFSQVLGVFGNDIKDNILILITFADHKYPPAIAALKAGKIPFVKYFKLNNSAFDLPENAVVDAADASGGCFAKMFWDMGMTAFSNLFLQLGKLETRSLTLTKKVLKRRQQLENSVENINPIIDHGHDIIENIRHNMIVIKRNEAEVNANENFTITETLYNRVTKPISDHTTTCNSCKWTCHSNCAYNDSADKARCCAMGDNGYCTNCPNKCHWSKHTNEPHIWVKEPYYVKREVADLKAKYFDCKSNLTVSQQLCQGLGNDLNTTRDELNLMIGKVRSCLVELSVIALRPNPMTHEDYIEKLIAAEENTRKPGWKTRVGTLHNMVKNNEVMTGIQEGNYDPFATSYNDVQKEMENMNISNAKPKKKKGFFSIFG